jgi:hypothetical protein
MNNLTQFEWRGSALPVTFVETTDVQEGVQCYVYQFSDDASKDLGIIHITAGRSTPLQRVLKGLRTIEGFMSGSGVLVVTSAEGAARRYDYPDEISPNEVEVQIGETMQWHATDDLTCYEICEPAYEDGRYENLPE